MQTGSASSKVDIDDTSATRGRTCNYTGPLVNSSEHNHNTAWRTSPRSIRGGAFSSPPQIPTIFCNTPTRQYIALPLSCSNQRWDGQDADHNDFG